ncbi:Omp28 family outer membrane lipoprotein [Flavobacteriales bacterium]|nr:Omp28 family outer membrane lipoprotein [Flavobacteriales bacterium]
MKKTFSELFVLGLVIAMVFVGCNIIDPPKYGCTDPQATNYDPNATHADGPCLGDCEYDTSDTTVVLGCTDQAALNYNPLATSNNCDCTYEGQRNVLIEDYTGHTCGNCPRAAEVIHDLEGTYGSRIIPIAIHVGFFADVQNNPDGSYSTNFKTQAGNQWNTEFGCSAVGLPTGLINRKQQGGQFPISYTAWTAEVANILDQEPDASLAIDIEYDESTRTVTADIDITAFNDLNSGPYNIIVCLTEDSIIDWQKDYDPALTDENLEDYMHMHALRTNFNGTWGNQVGSGNISAGSVIETSHSLVLDSEWIDHNCNVVAFIYQTGNKEVIQADYKHIIEE